jgi:hypothetical protein
LPFKLGYLRNNEEKSRFVQSDFKEQDLAQPSLHFISLANSQAPSSVFFGFGKGEWESQNLAIAANQGCYFFTPSSVEQYIF